ncbi:MAG: YHS domain-containing protein [Verrucomicrobiales bacterium]|nr:YHS domain-containing protein [Verrucomicrobiales bacterium]
MNRSPHLLLWLFLLSSPISLAADKSLLNLDKEGVAIQGFDPVAFFVLQAPLKGKAEFTSEHHGAKYRFHSAKNKAAFDSDPAKYEPRFGGYCAFGVSKGKLVDIDVNAFQIVEGRLLLQYSPSVRDQFNQDVAGNLKKAETQWPTLVEKKGK